MFTGIISEVGQVTALRAAADSAVIEVLGPATTQDLRIGESVAVAGVCLTAIAVDDGAFSADVMRETLRRSTLGTLKRGAAVNLERALPAAGRLDGHIVQGHVDGLATLAGRNPGDAWEDFFFALEPPLTRYVATKGSIAIDGVSLTVTTVWDEAADAPDGVEATSGFGVSLIPTTLSATSLGGLAIGESVNIETDVLAKYVERLTSLERGTVS